MNNQTPDTANETPLTLLLLPGMEGSGDLFGDFIAALGPCCTISVIRYPSDATWGYAELENFVRQALLPQGALVVLGESFSGVLAVRLAHSYPERVKGLVLCAAFVRNPYPSLAKLRPWLKFLPLAHLPKRWVAWQMLGQYGNAMLRQALFTTLERLAPEALRARLDAVLCGDVSAQFAELTLPVLYLRAKHDRVVPASAARWIASLRPQTQIVEFDAPHLLLQTQAEAAAAQLREFIAALGNRHL